MTKQHILITGASRGIGRALAQAFAARYGKSLHLSLLARDMTRLQALQQTLADTSVGIDCYSIDISDHAKVMALVAQIDSNRPIDTAVVNAGISGNTGDGWESWEQINAIMMTNSLGLMATVQPLITQMQTRGRGKIVLMSSISAYRGIATTPSYCASKAAVAVYGESLRGWLRGTGVAVITVLPGFVESDMSRNFSGPKPMMISQQRAVHKIIAGIEKGRTIIAFPFWMTLGLRIFTWLPAGLGDRILHRLGYGRNKQHI